MPTKNVKQTISIVPIIKADKLSELSWEGSDESLLWRMLDPLITSVNLLESDVSNFQGAIDKLEDYTYISGLDADYLSKTNTILYTPTLDYHPATKKYVDDSSGGSGSYTLPTASSSVLGGIKIGANLSIDGSSVLSSTDTNTTYSIQDGELSQNNLTTALKGNYDTAYTHSQASHAPSTAEANVQSDWNSASGDSLILNKPTLQKGWHGHTDRVKLLVTDFLPSDASSTYNLGVYDYSLALNALKGMSTSLDFYGYKEIPSGYKATSLTLYVYHKFASDSTAITVYEGFIDSSTAVSKGTANATGSLANFTFTLDFVDFNSTDTNQIMIHIDPASTFRLYGGYISISEI